jgi:NitT/TauT family transport system permease protein
MNHDAQAPREGAANFLINLVIAAVFLSLWEYGSRTGYLQPTFFGSPAGIGRFLWANLVETTKLWQELGWTLLGTALSFVIGSIAAILAGLLFVAMPRLERIADPWITAFNAMPRIALAPLLILWFGLGVASKVAIGASLCFFIVLSSTVAGIRGLNQDHATLTRALGGTPYQMFTLVTLPGAVPVIFSGLRLGLIYALLGVVAGELIAAEHGLGQTLSYLGSAFNMDGVLALIIMLSVLGMIVTWSMTAVERHLLRWQ